MTGVPGDSSVRAVYLDAAGAFLELVGNVRPGDWERPGLGAWDVRGLVGHTSRALSTVEAYLGRPAAGRRLEDPVDYLLAATGPVPADERRRRDDAIADRGRETAAALGDDPVAAVAALAGRVRALVESSPDDATVTTPAGTMPLAAYLPTRTFELAVHGLDLARALGVDPPAALRPAIAASCELAGRVAARHPAAPELLLMLTGRRDLPPDVSIV